MPSTFPRHAPRGALRLCLGVALLAWMGCRSRPPAESVAAPTSTAVSAPFDVASVMRQVHFAYRPEGEQWSGGHSTYEVRASTNGMSLTPFSPRDGRVKGAPLHLGPARLQRGDALLKQGEATGSVEAKGRLRLERAELTEHLANEEEGITQSWHLPGAPRGKGDLLVSMPATGLAFVESTAEGLHFAAPQTGLGFRYGHATWVDSQGQRTTLPAEYADQTLGFRVPEALVKSSAFPVTLATVITPEQGVDLPVHGPAWGEWKGAPSLGSNGTDYLVVWSDARGEYYGALHGVRVSSTGVVLDPSGIKISTEPGHQDSAEVASNGTDYLVVWRTLPGGITGPTADIQAARVTSAGRVEDTPSITLSLDSHDEHDPKVASVGTDYLVVWERQYPSGDSANIVGARVTSTGQRLEAVDLNLSQPSDRHHNPSVASNGTQYLVVWEDSIAPGERDIRGARVSALGEVVAESRRVISRMNELQVHPSVASLGMGFLVVWERVGDASGGGIYCARLSAEGEVLDGTGLLVSRQRATYVEPRVSANGANYLVAWDHGSGVHGALVTPEGTLGAPRALGPTTSVQTRMYPAVASNGADFFAVWLSQAATTSRSSHIIEGTRVTGTGTVVDSPTPRVLTTASNTQLAPAVATNGTNFLVVWEDLRGGGSDVYGARVTPTGELLDPQGIALSTAAFDQRAPAVASNGTDYLVVWSTYGAGSPAVAGVQVAGSGQVLSPQALSISNVAEVEGGAAVASNGTDYLVVWADDLDFNGPILGARVTRTGVVRDKPAIRIARSFRSRSLPSVASNGKDYFVVWQDARNTTTTSVNNDVYGSRVTSAGAVLETQGLRLVTAPSVRPEPRLASNGADYLVVWRAAYAVLGMRVRSDGQVLDPQGILITQSTKGHASPSVASLGAEYLVVWRDFRNEPPGLPSYRFKGDIYGARVTGAGLVREPEGLSIAADAQAEEVPAIVASPLRRSAFVVYQRYDASPSIQSRRSRGRFVSFNDNEPPTALGQNLLLPEDSALALILQGTDPEGQELTYSLGPAPVHGSLGGAGVDYVYTPVAQYHGLDSFTFQVSDGELLSAPATVTFQVTPVNDAPSVPGLLAPADGTESEGGLFTFTWSASTDIEGDAVSYHLELLQDGVVTRTRVTASTTYTLPQSEELPVGRYSWRVRAVDARSASSAPSAERVVISLPRRNEPPIANGHTAATNEDTALSLVLRGLDPEGQALTFTVTTPPANGALAGQGAALTYTPRANFHGADSFVFTVSDGELSSAPATVSLQVDPVNDAPSVPRLLSPADGVSQAVSGRVTFQWEAATDLEADAVSYEVELLQTGVVIHRHATARTSRALGDEEALPSGVWRWRVSASDSHGASSGPSAEWSFIVPPKPDLPPSATEGEVTTAEDTDIAVTLQGQDPEGRTLTFSIESLPKHGTLSGEGAERGYTPAANFHGEDRITFRVSDGVHESEPATVSIHVAPINDSPSMPRLLSPVDGAVVEGGLATFQWEAAVDVDGDALDYVLEFLQEGRVVRTFALPGATSRELVGEDERLAVGLHSWRVRAVDNQGGHSATEPSRTLTVVPRASPPPVDPGTGNERPRTSGCGCEAHPGAGASAPFAFALVLLLGRLARRGSRSFLSV
ncbi:tandem-95 repeat protein [Myxococcus sp. CA040A]|uniref:tandem-95 repeat protein n=1 Tax=Myxococcus sp. CA040A TaxID=2741738 RepID=UPI001C2D3FD6|nr:tandem-95 repeat protein [Myxococcus sp. CA040A]NTX07358.1 tandem-95 repeat protein [Myxococcus sp. CA040A]